MPTWARDILQAARLFSTVVGTITATQHVIAWGAAAVVAALVGWLVNLSAVGKIVLALLVFVVAGVVVAALLARKRLIAVARIQSAGDALTSLLRPRAIKGAAAQGETPPADDLMWARRWRGTDAAYNADTLAAYYAELRAQCIAAFKSAERCGERVGAELGQARGANNLDDLWALNDSFVRVRERLRA